ncbi:MAG: hypothetical protein Tsb0014_39480 [Pleurocapsa sp.]
MKNISLLWEIPLALLSFVFYKVMKFAIGNLFTIYLAIDKKKASQWRVLSQKIIDAPLSLPVLMTKGPRWNTHAVIGTLGPFKVEKSVAIDIETANNSARSWIAVVYSFPSYKTITSIESNKIASDNQWYAINLKPGKYSLGVRYYNRLDVINYPAIKIDDRDFVDTYNIPNNVNDYYHNLIQAKNWFYLSLHYYIYTILKLRKWLPESFVNREYLPVGAPDTYFVYNYLESEQNLELDIAPEIVNNFVIYFTFYDRSSLPISWCVITSEKYQFPSPQTNGFYLLRIRPKPEKSDNKITVQSSLIQEDTSTQHWQISQ